MQTICTISTRSHIPKVYALAESLKENSDQFGLSVLIVDTTDTAKISQSCSFQELSFYPIHDILKTDNSGVGQKIVDKYKKSPDKLRWCLKPVFISHLLKTGNSKVIYVDNDIFFVNNFDFLWNELNDYRILLTPHWRANTAAINVWLFETNFRDGVYNAGFIGASKGAESAMNWWAEVCLFRCTKSYIQGNFDDQKYLDMMPIVEEKTKILQHRGCNVAYWNVYDSVREEKGNEVLINGQFPIIFIHFADCTIAAIVQEIDGKLKPYLSKYLKILKAHKFEVDTPNISFLEKFWSAYRSVKWRLLRTLLN